MKRHGMAWLVLASLASSVVAADWPQFLGPDRNGISPEKGLARAWPAEGPKVLWTAEMGRGFGGACIQGGKVYVLDRPDERTETLRCLDLAKGEKEWEFSYAAPARIIMEPGSRPVPAADENHVYTIGAAGHIHCIDKKTRQPVWKKHLIEDFGGSAAPDTGVCQSPLLYKDTVIVAPLTGQVGVVALDKATGKEVWKSPALGTQKYSSPLVITAGGVEQVVILGTESLDAVQVGSGKPLWKFTDWRSTQPVPNPVPVGQDRLFFAGGYGLGFHLLKLTRQGETFAVSSLASGRRPAPTLQTPILYEGSLYVNSGRGGLMCVDLDGTTKWEAPRGSPQDLGNLVIADGLIYKIDSTNGVLTMVEAAASAYKELGRAQVLQGDKIWGPMALSDGKLVLRDLTQMKCVDVRRP